MRRLQTGFTLLELLVVIAIAAVLTGLAVPSFKATIQSAESREAATAFYATLVRARSEAIARNANISVCVRDIANPASPACSSTSTWQNGWIIYAGSTPGSPIQVHEPLPDGLTLGTVASPLVFDSTGRVATAITFDLCRGVGDSRGRRVSVSRSGRVALEQRPC